MVSSRVASLAGIIYLATIGISLAAPMNLAPSLLGLSRIPWTQVPNILFTLTLVSWVAFIPAIWLYRKSHRKPLLTNYQTDTWKTIAPVFAHFIPALKAEKSPAMENFLLKMVEKYYLMQPVLSGISSQDANRLSEILDLSARVAINLTEMDAFLSNPEFHLWGQRIQTLERALEDERDPEKRQAWVKQLSDLKDRIGEYFSIEEKFGKSMQSLSQLQFLFSQLTGKLLVYHTALDDADMIKLDDLSRELSHILDSNRELKATTRRAA